MDSHQDHGGQFSLAASLVGFATAVFGFMRGRKAERPEEDLRARLSRLEKRFDRLENAVVETQQSTVRLHEEIFQVLQARKAETGS